MNKEFEKLNNEFKRISRKSYIKGIYNSSSSIGRTFEHELGLEMNKESIPDYHGIEIKTRRVYTKSYLTLFSMVPSGPESLEINRIKEIYGYPYKNDHNYKCLYVEVFANKKNYSGRYYKYKLEIARKEEKLYLCIYNINNKLVEKKTFWSFSSLKERLEKKLKYLAVVHAWPKKIDNWNCYKYSDISFYKLIDFESFLKLLEEGIIKLTIKIDIYLDKNNYGKTYDHGCSFSIIEEYLTRMFYCYDIETGLYI